MWSDEFDGADGSAPDASRWTAEIGGQGWGNQEREYYTDSTRNARIEQGQLIIEATTDGVQGLTCWYGPCQYTSARLVTRGKFEFTYGRVEVRARITRGQGLWPAIWMLGNDIGTAGWPTCGEIDIMENIGREPAIVHGTIHGPGYSGGNGIGSSYTLPGGAAFADAFHDFAIEWDASQIRFYVDGNNYATRTPSELPSGAAWVYDHDFFLLLNVAVGGLWPGDPDSTTQFPQQMLIEYVRVYQRI